MRSDPTLLLAAIRANPREDTPLLAYADCVEEHGDARHAELIRNCVAWSRMQPDAKVTTTRRWPDGSTTEYAGVTPSLALRHANVEYPSSPALMLALANYYDEEYLRRARKNPLPPVNQSYDKRVLANLYLSRAEYVRLLAGCPYEKYSFESEQWYERLKTLSDNTDHYRAVWVHQDNFELADRICMDAVTSSLPIPLFANQIHHAYVTNRTLSPGDYATHARELPAIRYLRFATLNTEQGKALANCEELKGIESLSTYGNFELLALEAIATSPHATGLKRIALPMRETPPVNSIPTPASTINALAKSPYLTELTHLSLPGPLARRFADALHQHWQHSPDKQRTSLFRLTHLNGVELTKWISAPLPPLDHSEDAQVYIANLQESYRKYGPGSGQNAGGGRTDRK